MRCPARDSLLDREEGQVEGEREGQEEERRRGPVNETREMMREAFVVP